MFAPEKRNAFPFIISVAPDLVTKLGRLTPAVDAATPITHRRTQASAASAAIASLPHPLGSHHVICRPRRPVAPPGGRDFHHRARYRSDHVYAPLYSQTEHRLGWLSVPD